MNFRHAVFSLTFWYESLHRGVLFGLLGFLLSMGSPVGWYYLSYGMDEELKKTLIYFYLMIPTSVVFTCFGSYVGYLYNKIKLLAENDSLTDLLNQRSFYRISEYLFAMASRRSEKIAVLMMDIDHFKKVNDFNNHLVGSHILTELGNIIKISTRKSDVLARFGGDEFIIFMNNISEENIKIIAERIREKVEKKIFKWGKYEVRITISIGVCIGVADEKKYSVKDFVKASDDSLYDAKNTGKNKVSVSRLGQD